ncbi:hypothetical protein BH11BAC1_BH11BAC1_24000 [soil metagenome]
MYILEGIRFTAKTIRGYEGSKVSSIISHDFFVEQNIARLECASRQAQAVKADFSFILMFATDRDHVFNYSGDLDTSLLKRFFVQKQVIRVFLRPLNK